MNQSFLSNLQISNRFITNSLFFFYFVAPIIRHLGYWLSLFLVKKLEKFHFIQNSNFFKKAKSLCNSTIFFEKLTQISTLVSILLQIYLLYRFIGSPIFFEKEFFRFWQNFSIQVDFLLYRISIFVFNFFLSVLPFSKTKGSLFWRVESFYFFILNSVLNIKVVQQILEDEYTDIIDILLTIWVSLLHIFAFLCNCVIVCCLGVGVLLVTGSLKYFLSILKTEKTGSLRIKKIPKALTKTCFYLITREKELISNAKTDLEKVSLLTTRTLLWVSIFFGVKNFIMSL